MLGNPYVKFMQQFFIRADTGTTIDNLYTITGVSHNVSPDGYDTQVELTPYDAYFTFFSMSSQAQAMKKIADLLEKQENPPEPEYITIYDAYGTPQKVQKPIDSDPF